LDPSLVALTGCAGSTTSGPRACATATTTRAATATATATPLPDPVQTPTTVVLGATPSADPSQCSPASTAAPLPTTLTTLFTGDANGTLTALNASDGTTRWRYATGVTTPLNLVPDGALLYASFKQPTGNLPTAIVALGSADGAVQWQAHLPSSSSYAGGAALTVVGGVDYAAVVDGTLHALDGATGAERWQYQIGTGIPQVTVSGGIAYGQDGITTNGLVALRASDGTLLWRFPTAAHVEMVPVVANGLVYVGQSPSTLVALNAVTGAVHWSDDLAVQHEPSNLNSAVAAGTGLYVNAAHGIYALNASTGALCWVAPANGQFASSVPLLDGTAVYETSILGSPGPGFPFGGSVFAVDAHTGAARARQQPALCRRFAGAGVAAGERGRHVAVPCAGEPIQSGWAAGHR
jgi:outer membrane protein assembly factor BamB